MIFFINSFYMNSKCTSWLSSPNTFIPSDTELKYIATCLLENPYASSKKEKKRNILIDKTFEKKLYR